MKLLMSIGLVVFQLSWSVNAHALAMTCAQAEAQQIKSVKGDTPVSVLFQNSRTTGVDVFWLNYERAGQLYKTLGPGESYTQQTFMTHPWVFVETGNAANCLGVYIPDSAQNTHVIQ